MPPRIDETRRSWADIDAAYAALQADPDGWVEFQAAQNSWNAARKSQRDVETSQSGKATGDIPLRSER